MATEGPRGAPLTSEWQRGAQGGAIDIGMAKEVRCVGGGANMQVSILSKDGSCGAQGRPIDIGMAKEGPRGVPLTSEWQRRGPGGCRL